MASCLSSKTTERQAAPVTSLSSAREGRTDKGHTDRGMELPATAMMNKNYYKNSLHVQWLAEARQTSNHGGKAMSTPILRHNDLSLQDARSRGRLG
jgi:hypothetical protein